MADNSVQVVDKRYIDYDTAVRYYGKSEADKLKAAGKTSAAPYVPAPPTPDTGDVYGTPEQIKNRLLKRYAEGQIPQNMSAEITENPQRPGQQMILYSNTPRNQDSTIKYYAPQAVPMTSPMPEGELMYNYKVGVEYPEQEAEIKKWAEAKGITVRRSRELPGPGSPPIELILSTKTQLSADTALDISSAGMIQEARTFKQAGTMNVGQRAYGQANPLEKLLYNVRTILSPAGYEYVGAAARGPAGVATMGLTALTNLPIIDYFFPNIKTTQQVIEEDITRRAAEGALGKKTRVMGVEIPEAVVSALNNPVIEVEMMALGGAVAAKFAATGIGGKIIGSTAGKIGAGILTGVYVLEKGLEIQVARSEGRSTEALGHLVTSIAGLTASAAVFRTEFTHIIKARAEKIIKVDIAQVAGGSRTGTTEQPVMMDRGIVKEGSVVSQGKFKIVEGKLKGLKGETFSISREKTGEVYTYIPEQQLKVGSTTIKIPEQRFTQATRFGTVSEKLKLYWRESGDWIIAQGRKSKIFGPKKETSLIEEVSRTTGPINVEVPGPKGIKVTMAQEAIVRKFSGLSAGTSAKNYDVYILQSGGQTVIAEKGVISGKSVARLDWVDVSFTKTGGAAMTVYPGARVKISPVTTSAALGIPAIPQGLTIKVQPQMALPAARLVWSANPTPGPGVLLKTNLKVETVKINVGAPAIVRTKTLQQEKQGTVIQRSGARTIAIPDIKRATMSDVKIEQRGIALPITSPITGQKVSQKERAAVIAVLAPIIDRIANQPTNRVPAPNVMPPIVIPNLGLIPYLRMDTSNIKIERFGRGVIVNPVPNIERLI